MILLSEKDEIYGNIIVLLLTCTHTKMGLHE